MLFTKSTCLGIFLALAKSVSSLTVSLDTVYRNPVNLQIGDLNIDNGAYLTIIDNLLTTILGSLDNEGGFYVTSDNGLAAAVALVSGTITNAGDVSFDSLSANVASTYDLASIGDFKNTGNMWFGSADAIANAFTITSVTNWENDGLLYFKQGKGLASLVTLNQVVGNGLLTIHNEGQMCFENTRYVQVSSIAGSGCIVALKDATIQLQLNVANVLFSVSETQTIYLEDSSSELALLGLSVQLLSKPTFKVAGFGNGNKITVDLSFTGYGYDSTTGILSLTFLGLLGADFNIGKGYTTFQTNGLGLTGTQIWVDYAAPNTAPTKCACAPFPTIPTLPPSSTSSSTTSSSSLTSSSTGSSSTGTSTGSSTTSSSTSTGSSTTSSSTTTGSSTTSSSTTTGSSTTSSSTATGSSTTSSSTATGSSTTGSSIVTGSSTTGSSIVTGSSFTSSSSLTGSSATGTITGSSATVSSFTGTGTATGTVPSIPTGPDDIVVGPSGPDYSNSTRTPDTLTAPATIPYSGPNIVPNTSILPGATFIPGSVFSQPTAGVASTLFGENVSTSTVTETNVVTTSSFPTQSIPNVTHSVLTLNGTGQQSVQTSSASYAVIPSNNLESGAILLKSKYIFIYSLLTMATFFAY